MIDINFYKEIIEKEKELNELIENKLINTFLLEEYKNFYQSKLDIVNKSINNKNIILYILKVLLTNIVKQMDNKKYPDTDFYELTEYFISDLFFNNLTNEEIININEQFEELFYDNKNKGLKEKIRKSLTQVYELPDEEVPELNV